MKFDPSSSRAIALIGLCLGCALTTIGCGDNPATSAEELRELVAKGHHDKALVIIKSGLEKAPNNTELRLNLARVLFAQGRAESAVLEFEKYLLNGGQEIDVIPGLLNALLATGQYQKVIDHWSKKVFADRSSQAHLLASVALAQGALGDNGKAIATAKEAITYDQSNPIAGLILARAEAVSGQAVLALEKVNAILKLHPQNREGWLLRGDVLALDAKSSAEAESSYRRAIEISPRYIAPYFRLFDLPSVRTDPTKQDSLVKAMRAALPKHPDSRLLEAQLAFVNKDFQKVREITSDLMKVAQENVRVLYLAGTAAFKVGDKGRARALLGQALQLAPNSTAVRSQLAQLEVTTGQPARALQLLDPLLHTNKPELSALILAAEASQLIPDFKSAKRYYERATELYPNDNSIRVASALLLIASGEQSVGIRALNDMSSIDASTVADKALLNFYLHSGDAIEAQKIIDKIRKKSPTDALPWLLEGRLLAQRGDLAAARAKFEKAIAIDSDYFSAIEDLVDLDVFQENYDAAVAQAKVAYKSDSKNVQAILLLARTLRKAKAARDEVESLLSNALSIAPNDPRPRIELVHLSLEKKDFKRALLLAQEANSAIPDNLSIVDLLGRAQLLAGEVQQSLSTFRKMAASKPESQVAYIRLAEAYIVNKNYSEAEAQLRKAIELAPDDNQAVRLLVQINIGQKKYGEALAVAKAVQHRKVNSPFGHIVEGDIYMSASKPELAVASYNRALKIGPVFEVAKKYYMARVASGSLKESKEFAESWISKNPRDLAFRYFYGLDLLARKEYLSAEMVFKEISSRRTKDASALNNLAWALHMQRKPSALAISERAVSLAPKDANVHDTLAQIYLAVGDREKAIAAERKAVDLAPGEHSLKLSLARMLIAAGDKAGAKRELDVLTSLGPSFPKAAEVRALLNQVGAPAEHTSQR